MGERPKELRGPAPEGPVSLIPVCDGQFRGLVTDDPVGLCDGHFRLVRRTGTPPTSERNPMFRGGLSPSSTGILGPLKLKLCIGIEVWGLGFGFRGAGLRLQAAGFRLQVSEFGTQAA